MKNRHQYRAMKAGTYDFIYGSLIDSKVPHIQVKEGCLKTNHQVEENTIGQCIGIHAKKSYRKTRMLFEGDQCLYYAGSKPFKCFVVWDQLQASFVLRSNKDSKLVCFVCFKNIEIIGTIHDK